MKLILTFFLTFLFVNASQFEQKELPLFNVNKKTATINIGSLTIGQSGVVIHKFNNNRSIILTKAIVTKTNVQNSTITFDDSNIIKQEALPRTNVKPSNKDLFLLNHLWSTTLLITPNFEAKQKITTAYYKNNFIDTDIFAAWLKINSTPVPNKDDFQKFTSYNNIGTIFIQLENQLYIVDAVSFKVLEQRKIKIEDKKMQVPFFSNVQDITKGVFSWFSPSKIDNYDKYYKNLIGIKND